MNLSLSIPLLMLWFDAPDITQVGKRLILLHPVDSQHAYAYAKRGREFIVHDSLRRLQRGWQA